MHNLENMHKLRIVHESPRIAPKSFCRCSLITKNHPQSACESLRITWESLRNIPESFQSGFAITKNCSQISRELPTNHWESPQNHFRVVRESQEKILNNYRSVRDRIEIYSQNQYLFLKNKSWPMLKDSLFLQWQSMEIPALSLQCHQWVMIHYFVINTNLGNKSPFDPFTLYRTIFTTNYTFLM